MPPVRLLVALALAAIVATAANPVSGLGGPVSASLSGAARGLAPSGNGALVVVGTADGAYGFTSAGEQVFHVLAGKDVTAVGVDRFGDEVVAGDGNGLVHFLHADGTEFATGVALGAVTVASMSDDGSVVAVGTAQDFLSAYDPNDALPPPLPALPANPLNLLLPQWSYNLGSPVTFVSVTADGQWVDAANAGTGPAGRAWLFGNDGELIPGALVANPVLDLPPCYIGQVPVPDVKCWIYQQYTPGASVTGLSAARNSYSMVISYSSGWTIATSAASYFANPWSFRANGAPSAVQMSADGSRVVIGDSFGNVYGLANVNRNGDIVDAQWSANIGAKVTRAAVSGNGAVNAAADATGAITLFDANGNALGTASAGGALTGLALNANGSRMVGTTGTQALFWS
ncbi:MAG: hypothetical protein LC624_06145 [Halobacteriales archaeon]|nr:hypothetical protein [Halobacteriales archaeon]